MQTSQKRFVPVIIGLAVIAVLAVAGAGVWYFTQNDESKPVSSQKAVEQDSNSSGADEIDNWLVDTDYEHGFEIKYPNDWIVQGTEIVNVVQKGGKGIVIISMVDNLNTAISVLQKRAKEDAGNLGDFKEEQIKIDNIIASKFTYKVDHLKPTGDPGLEINVFAAANGKNYKIFFQTTAGNSMAQIFGRILSTFKFIEPQTISSGKNDLQAENEAQVGENQPAPGNEIYDALFNQYKTLEAFSGKPAPLDFSNNPSALLYKTRITNAYSAFDPSGKNYVFGGHYVFTAWGCGTECRMGAIIDLKNGKIYDIPGGEDEAPNWGYYFVENSNLLIIDPIGTTRCLSEEAVSKFECPPAVFYLWENNQFKKLQIDQARLIKQVDSLPAQVDKCAAFFNDFNAGDNTADLPMVCDLNIGKGFGNWSFIVNASKIKAPYIMEIWDGNGASIQKIPTGNFDNDLSFDSDYIPLYYNYISFADDINFDGYNDLRVVDHPGPPTGADAVGYNYWIFNPGSKKFEKDPILTNIINASFNKNEKTITSKIGVSNACFKDPGCDTSGYKIIYKFNSSRGAYQKIYDGPGDQL